MSPSETQQTSSWSPIRWILGGLAVVIFYVLSAGPAIYLRERGAISAQVIKVIYYPLAFVENWPVPGNYFRWWMEKGEKAATDRALIS